MNEHEIRRISETRDILAESMVIGLLKEESGLNAATIKERVNQVLCLNYFHCKDVILPRLAENGEVHNESPGLGPGRWVLTE